MRPAVTVIVLNYNGQLFLEQCLASLRQTRYPNMRVLLLDNGSTDGSAALVQRSSDGLISPFLLPENLGFAKGMNFGLRFEGLSSAYAVLLNNDTVVDENWLEELVAVMESDPRIAAAQPKLLSLRYPGRFDYSGAAGGFMDRYGHTVCRGRLFETLEEDTGQYDEPCEVFWAGGAALMLRMSALAESGLLDEDYWAHWEEIDLCWRLRLLGYRIVAVPRAVVWHIDKGSANPHVRYLNHRNTLVTLLKNYTPAQLRQFFPRRLLLDLLNLGYAASCRDFGWVRDILRAHLWVTLHLLTILRKRRRVQRRRRVSEAEMTGMMIDHSVIFDYFLRGHRRFSEIKHPLHYLPARERAVA